MRSVKSEVDYIEISTVPALIDCCAMLAYRARHSSASMRSSIIRHTFGDEAIYNASLIPPSVDKWVDEVRSLTNGLHH
jgi:hypothetical protein